MQTQDRPPDMGADTGHGERWMTFGELATARRISKASATKLVRRHGWRRQPDNEGHVRALVPLTWASLDNAGEPDSAADRTPVSTAPRPGDSTGDISRAINALETAVAKLSEQLARENTRADGAERRAEAERSRADRAEAEAKAAVAQTEQLRRVLRDAEAGLTAERAARAAAEAEKALAEGEAARMLADLRQATEEAEIEALASQEDRVESEAAIKAAEAEVAELRQALDRARQTAEAETAVLREALERATKATRAAEAARDADRPSMVASRLDEVQFRRLQEAETARKALGRLARLRAAWRGE